MSDTVIKVENLSKQYRLGEVGTGTLAHDLNRWWHRVRGKEDPYLKIGEENNRASKGSSDYVWALKDINFEVKQGEMLGIIGRNGAGKSTLLKILSRTTTPTTGSVKIKGRVASLLEVGTGFHPELSGRDNIFLNGAILGMTKYEINSKLDEIIDFAGVERYIDTPVKRYSSGMYVRLAFAVAAHLDPEILIVDEVLAVGDAEFQRKALGKMKDVTKQEGRTVLFVSHNVAAVKQLCNTGIVLFNGATLHRGTAVSAIEEYYKSHYVEHLPFKALINKLHDNLIIDKLFINNSQSAPILANDNKVKICFQGICISNLSLNIEVRFYTNENILVALYSPGHLEGQLITIDEGEFSLERSFSLPDNMANGEYYVSLSLARPNVETYLELKEFKFLKEGLKTVSGRSLSYNEVGFFLIA